MSDDGIEMRIKSVGFVCPTCIRLSFDGVKSKPGRGLARDGLIHACAVDADDKAICDDYSGWNAVITVEP